MAKREFSSTLKNLKFMQRAAKKEKPKQEEATLKQENSFGSSVALSRKCIVIMEGNPHPGVVKGRMSFQNFNPSVDKMKQEVANTHNKQACNSINENQNVMTSYKDDGYPSEPRDTESPKNYPEFDLKRKQPEVASGDGDGCPSSQHNRKGSHKQQKREKLDWNLLRPPKVHARRNCT